MQASLYHPSASTATWHTHITRVVLSTAYKSTFIGLYPKFSMHCTYVHTKLIVTIHIPSSKAFFLKHELSPHCECHSNYGMPKKTINRYLFFCDSFTSFFPEKGTCKINNTCNQQFEFTCLQQIHNANAKLSVTTKS